MFTGRTFRRMFRSHNCTTCRFRPRGNWARLAVQRLEDRTVPATFTVTSGADSGTGTLREAMTLANANLEDNTIAFTPGTFDVFLSSALPIYSATYAISI